MKHYLEICSSLEMYCVSKVLRNEDCNKKTLRYSINLLLDARGLFDAFD